MDLTLFARDGATTTLDSLANGICGFRDICEKTSIPQETVELRLSELIKHGLARINNESTEKNKEYEITDKGKKATKIMEEINQL